VYNTQTPITSHQLGDRQHDYQEDGNLSKAWSAEEKRLHKCKKHCKKKIAAFVDWYSL
jgi:hypothetical protein